jgi:ATP-binding cassette, subfamily C, bacterial LapB
VGEGGILPGSKDQPTSPATAGPPPGGERFRVLPLDGLPWARFDVLAASFTLNLLALVMPIVILQTYDRIVPNNSYDTLLLLVVFVAGALVLDAFLRLGRTYVTGWAAARFEHRLGCSMVSRLLSADLASFERFASGVHLDRMSAIDRLRDFYCGQSILVMVDLPFALLFLALIAYLAGALVLVPFAVLVAFAFLAWKLGRNLRVAIENRSEVDDRRYNFIIELLTGIHTVKALGMEAQMVRRYERLQESSAASGIEVNMLSGRAQSLGALFSNLTMVLTAGIGCLWVINGELTTGGLAASSLLAGRSLQPLLRAMGLWTQFQNVEVARGRVTEAMATPQETPIELPALPPIEGALELKNVHFAYDADRPELFSGIDLKVPAGGTIGIRGANGIGKSTLLRLIMRLYVPTAGRITLDGHDITDFDPQSIREQVVYLPQQSVLFQGTIMDNLTSFRGDEAIEPALEMAIKLGLDSVIARLPDGYQSRIGESGTDALPGGIRQRIAIAHALARKPKVVLFDEANSYLDAAGDAMLRAVLEEQKGRTTLVLVSHRPSLLQLADDLYEIQEGRLVHRTARPRVKAPAQHGPAPAAAPTRASA